MMRIYLSGPMSGLPSFNFPAFHAAARALRTAYGWEVISPAETDSPEVQVVAMASKDGKYDAAGKVGGETWGDMLAKDVKMLADGVQSYHDGHHPWIDDGRGNSIPVLSHIDGIVFLPGWERSRGARLEAFVGTLTNKLFWEYDPASEFPLKRSQHWVMRSLFIHGANMKAGVT